jgi:hypothetical protein
VTRGRITALALLIVAAAALSIAYLQYRRARVLAPPLVRLEAVEGSGIVDDLVEGTSRLRIGDPPRARVPEEPVVGQLYHVAVDGDDSSEGTRERPWRDLASALCRLGPGDRLYVLPGEYAGPLHISPDCRDGTAERPIEVYAADDATIVTGADPSKPVLTVARAHWHLEGLEVSAGPPDGPAIAFEAGAHHVELIAAHLFGATGDGIEIRPGSELITIRDSHLHHLGKPGVGGPGDTEPPAVARAAIRIFPGTRAIRIEDCRLHNIGGELVSVVTPEQHLATVGELLPATADLVVDREEFQSGQAQW